MLTIVACTAGMATASSLLGATAPSHCPHPCSCHIMHQLSHTPARQQRLTPLNTAACPRYQDLLAQQQLADLSERLAAAAGECSRLRSDREELAATIRGLERLAEARPAAAAAAQPAVAGQAELAAVQSELQKVCVAWVWTWAPAAGREWGM